MKARTVYRNASVVIASRLGVVAAVLLAIFGGTAKHGQAALVVMAALLLGFCIRVGRAGIRVEPEGIKVVGMLSASPRIPWADIDHFAIKPVGQYPAVAAVVLKDGREYSCLAIGSTTRLNPGVEESTGKVQRTVEELNALVRERTTPMPASDPTNVQGFLDRLT